MNTKEFRDELSDMIYEHFEDDDFLVNCETLEFADIPTNDEGIVVTFKDGSKFHIIIRGVSVRNAGVR